MSEHPSVRTAPDPGHGLCPNCGGRGWCKWCGGTGAPLVPTSKKCDGCEGKGRCVLCEGDGQLVDGHYAFAEWNKRAPMNPALSVEDRALSEKMYANKMKYMQKRSVQEPPPPRPMDTPMLKRWQSEEFLGGSESSDSASENGDGKRNR